MCSSEVYTNSATWSAGLYGYGRTITSQHIRLRSFTRKPQYLGHESMFCASLHVPDGALDHLSILRIVSVGGERTFKAPP